MDDYIYSMKEQDALCLFRGFRENEIQIGLSSAEAALKEAGYVKTRIHYTVISDKDLELNVGDYIENLIRMEKVTPAADAVDTAKGRAVLILTNDKQRLFKLMRGIKSVSPEPQDIIFASVTETALTWSFKHYFSHLSQEHEYMKTHSPEGDPDMKVEKEL